jgi:hypothetical protein
MQPLIEFFPKVETANTLFAFQKMNGDANAQITVSEV